jgi:EAL domain-containing protein (putative c-di-GMP-specific phosphodiesterase class I)
MGGQWLNFFDISFRVQSLALAVVILLIIDFLKNKKLPLRSTVVFGCFLFVGAFNLVADFVSYFTLLNYQVVPGWVNRIVHIAFIGSLELLTVCLFLYVFYLHGAQKRLVKWQVILAVTPFVLAAVTSVFASIEYIVDEHGAYSTGLMVYILYGSIVVYVLATCVLLFRKNNNVSKESNADYARARITVAVGLGIWIVVALIQFITKYVLISSIGNSLMLLYIYLNFENPKRYADDETDTLNRQAFHIMVPEMLARRRTFWLVNFTVDDNDQISRSMGYDAMKVILRTAADRLRTVVPRSGFFHSRSNTLSVFVSDRDQLDALLKRAGTADFQVPWNNGTFKPQYHITIMECPKYGGTSDEIYDTMDYVMEHHRHHEKGHVLWVDEETIRNRDYSKQVLAVLTKAVQEKAFDVVYQPIWSTMENRFASAEALVRLQDCGDLGFISPEIFIPMAEQQGMIGEIGSIVFEKVCSFASENRLWEKGVNYIEVNLSGMQSVDPALPAQLMSVMHKYGIQPKFINLEITETASIDGGEMLDVNMKRLRSLGCHFSMDDFGTGYSNLAKMAKVHFELVKLDKSLIWPAFGENPGEPMVILNSCIAMILQLGAHIVAEGVETQEQADFLTEQGVNYLQGYYYSKPISGDTFLEKLSAAVK